MVECVEGTVSPIDQRVLNRLLASNNSHGWEGLRFDEDYLSALPAIHGGTPVNPYFTDSIGRIHRIGWFVSVYDHESELPGDLQEDHMYHESDTRVIDRSLPYLLGGESSIYAPVVDAPLRFYPFAALHGDPIDGDDSAPFTLCWHFAYGQNSLCFDLSTNPISVVFCEYRKAIDAFIKYDDHPDNHYDYGFLVPVAKSFAEFVTLLRYSP